MAQCCFRVYNVLGRSCPDHPLKVDCAFYDESLEEIDDDPTEAAAVAMGLEMDQLHARAEEAEAKAAEAEARTAEAEARTAEAEARTTEAQEHASNAEAEVTRLREALEGARADAQDARAVGLADEDEPLVLREGNAVCKEDSIENNKKT